MIDSDILKGILFSLFTDKGPEPKYWYPQEMDINMLMKISVKSITLLAGDSGETTNQFAFIQFPDYHISTLLYLFGIPKENVRGQTVAASIAILIEDKYSSLFHINSDELENIIRNYAEQIIEYEKNDIPSNELVHKLFDIINENIKIYKKHEIITYKIRAEELNKKNYDKEYKFKIGLVGASGTGKTALLLRFCEEAFRDKYIATDGVTINVKALELKEDNILAYLNIWDYSGQYCYLEMNEKLLAGCDAIIYVYDITRMDSFKELEFWYKWVLDTIGYKIGVIVANKIDLNIRNVDKEIAKNFAKKLKLGYVETSAKTGTNINKLFYNLCKAIIKLYGN